MKKTLSILLIIAYFTILPAQQLSKVYVLSEGGFSAGSSDISMLDIINNSYSQGIISPGNLGLYPDGIILYDNYLYIAEQGSYGGSGKIYKADTTGLIVSSAEAGTNPYSIAIANSKIYITNGPAGNVSVHNLNDLSFIKNITVGAYPQEILAVNNKIFVANTSIYMGAEDSTVSVIDTDTDTEITKIIVKKDPASLAVSNEGNLLIGCPGDGDNGKIFTIDLASYNITDTISLPVYGFGKDLCIDKNNSDLFFIAYTNDIVKYDAENSSITKLVSSVYPANYYYGYNYEYTTGKHYVLDAKTFAVSGSLSIYNNEGTAEANYETGIAPRRVLFKYTEQPDDVSDNPAAAVSFSLAQNYPNPFNPATIIQYSVPAMHSGETVSLKVYDILGNEISTLVNEVQPAGQYEITFNASGLSSGVYFYRLTAGNFTGAKQMVLLR
jgi:YVTN family beta-propeller protein